MSAPNFYSKAGIVFALADDECEYFLEDTEQRVRDELAGDEKLSVAVADEWDGERNYGGRYFARVETHARDDAVSVEAGLLVRGGYYSGGNLDYEIMIYDSYTGEYIDVDEFTPEDLADLLEDYHNEPRAYKQLYKQLMKDAEYLKKQIEKVYKNETTPLQRIATFSNGEAVYTKKILRG